MSTAIAKKDFLIVTVIVDKWAINCNCVQLYNFLLEVSMDNSYSLTIGCISGVAVFVNIVFLFVFFKVPTRTIASYKAFFFYANVQDLLSAVIIVLNTPVGLMMLMYETTLRRLILLLFRGCSHVITRLFTSSLDPHTDGSGRSYLC